MQVTRAARRLSAMIIQGLGAVLPRTAVTLAAVSVLAAGTPLAVADEFLDKANAPFLAIPVSQRMETTLLPAIAKLTPPPAKVERLALALLVTADNTGWAAVSEWCTSDPSKAALEALKKVTEENDWRKAPTFALPYGAEAADPDLVTLGMYVELGDPPSLAMAEFKYLPAVERLVILIQAEVTRLQAAGETAKAIDLLVRQVYLGRQMCDRGFFREQKVGYATALTGLMRVRDVIYQDLRSGNSKLTAEQVRDQVRRLRDGDGVLGLERLKLPVADRLAGEQLLFRLMTPGAGPDAAQFPRLLTQLGAPERPLRKLSDWAKWDAIKSVHANEVDTRKQLMGVFGDWEKRWRMRPTDPGLKTLTDFMKTSRARFGSVDKLIGDLDSLFPLRTQLIVEAAGTRVTMGVYGFVRKENGNFPPSIVSGVPDILREQDMTRDLFTGDRREHLRYIIPGQRGQATVDVQVFNAADQPAFSVTLTADSFILYSVGPDGNLNGMRRATQMVQDDKGDYLVFPPMLSLIRQNAIDTGELK